MKAHSISNTACKKQLIGARNMPVAISEPPKTVGKRCLAKLFLTKTNLLKTA